MPPLEREPAIRPDAAGRSPRDERGSTLVLVLALVIFVSIAAVAVLDQETTASNAQRAYENLRVGDQAADSTVNALIHTMRYNQTQGAAAPEVVPSGTLCSNTTGWSQVNGQQVYCQADPSSLTLQRDASDLPPNAILTLGGLDGRGNRQADTSATPASYNAPFCDDYHDFQAGNSSDRCETGLFVGRGVSDTSTNGGGLYVAETGRIDRTQPLVASNSSIVINPANALRSLTVDGTVWARRGCGSGAGPTLDASQIFAGHDPKTGASDAARRLCAGGSDPTKWQNPTSGGLASDPDYTHEPIDLSSVPRVDNWTNHPGPTLPLDPNTICRNGNAGFAVMPAAKIGTRTINGTSYDVFGAWYDSASALNNLFGSALCADTFFWFRPGVYYFDFLDTNTTNWYTQSDNNKGVSTAWNNAAGCWPLPTNTLCTVDEVVGGLPPDSPSPLNWNTCDTYLASGTVVNCPQPTKVMYPEKSSGATSSDWTTHPENTSRIDEQVGSTAVGAGNIQSTLTSDQLQTPIPQLANTTIGAVTELKLEIAYKLYNTKGLTGAAAFKDQSLDKQNLGPGADVKLIIGGLTGGSCTIHLYPGDHSATTRGTPDHATGPGEVFNLLNDCNPASPDRTFTKDGVAGPNYYIADVGAGWPSSAAAWSAHPEYINRLRATIQVTAPNTAPAGSSIMEMDGLQFDVSWKGRPAPAYPGACDRTLPGVQWIFGGVARINWGNTSSDQFAELCASKQSAFPNWGIPNWGNGSNATRNDNGSNLGIAVYGMSEDSAGPAPVLSTDAAPTFLAPDAANTTTTPPWTNAGTPVNYYKINDPAAPASAVWSNANWGTATLAFTLQNVRGYGAGQIPPGSTITGLKLVVRHREGGTLNGTWYPGGWINKDQLTITPGTGNYGSNGYSASNWNSNAVGSPIVGTWGGFPPCYTGANNDSGDCTFTWGDPAAPAGTGTPDWSQQRDLTDSIDTPEALEGASVKWTVAVATSCAGCTHEVYVDGIVLAITYRPAGSLRPLAGCTTIRAGTYPPYLLGSSSSPLSTAQHDWLDADWGPNKSPSSAGDQAFGNFSGVNGGTGGMADAQDCPLLDVNNISANVKFHAQGMIYAPSAAVSLSGNQNDAAWFSDGIVARQLSALKWTKGNDIAVVGGEPPPRNPRLVNIEICDGSGDSSGCPPGHVTLREQFEIDDVAPGIGNVVKRLSYVQLPPS